MESGSDVAKNLRGRQGFAHVRVDNRDIGNDIGVVHKLRPAARVAPGKGHQQGWSTVRGFKNSSFLKAKKKKKMLSPLH